MTVTRVPCLAHWGAFTALVQDGRIIGCEPFERDPAPSPMLAAIPDMVHSPLRIAQPGDPRRMARGAAANRHRAFSRSVLGGGARPGCRRTRPRPPRFRKHVDIWRVLAGRQPAGCTRARSDAPLSISWRRVRRSGRKLQLGCGAIPAPAHHWHLSASHWPGDRLGFDRQTHKAHDRLRRIGIEECASDVRRRGSART